jgi:hypothetical protein
MTGALLLDFQLTVFGTRHKTLPSFHLTLLYGIL